MTRRESKVIKLNGLKKDIEILGERIIETQTSILKVKEVLKDIKSDPTGPFKSIAYDTNHWDGPLLFDYRLDYYGAYLVLKEHLNKCMKKQHTLKKEARELSAYLSSHPKEKHE